MITTLTMSKWLERLSQLGYRIQVGDKRAQAYAYALILGTLMFMMEWAGSRGSLLPWGDIRRLSEIWWHFPLYLAFVFVIYNWWYRNV
jgi:hypothetical protein